MGECVPEMLGFLCVSPALPKTVFGFAGGLVPSWSWVVGGIPASAS